MKDHLRQLVGGHGPLRGRNIAREYLQARILGAFQRAGAMTSLAFRGEPACGSCSACRGTPRTSTSLCRNAVAERLDRLDWNRAASDVRPFLERDEDADLVDRNQALRLLR